METKMRITIELTADQLTALFYALNHAKALRLAPGLDIDGAHAALKSLKITADDK